MRKVDIAVIGGGPAGLAAALGAKEAGIENILILERESYLGGILNQCIHPGFGLHIFKEELTGPEYAARYALMVKKAGIPFLLDTMVLDISPDKKIAAVNQGGLLEIDAKAVILAMGCRERPRGAVNIPGSRPAGILTAGCAQKFVNLDGYMPGKEVVVLGSGDIGLIMARRMTLEGAKVLAVIERMPYPGGLKRNVVQCLDDFSIPLLLSHTITEIKGGERLEGVTIAKVDGDFKPISGTEKYIPCDTLLLSVGLIPENELSKKARVTLSGLTGGPVVDGSLQTDAEGIFACGNVLHVHDLVDTVSEEGALAGKNAALYVRGKGRANIGEANGRVSVSLRVDSVFRESEIICTCCPLGCPLSVVLENGIIAEIKGAECEKGVSYARSEHNSPTRMFTSTVTLLGSPLRRLPVKTERPIPKGMVMEAARSLKGIEVRAPVAVGQVVLENICGTGVNLVATRNAPGMFK